MKPHHISDETLFAYVDGELDAGTRASVEVAIAADPELARRVEQQRSLRVLLGEVYRPVLDEPMPERLRAAVGSTGVKAQVLDLAAARERRRPLPPPAANDWSWKHWGGMAACLVVGVLAGRSAWIGGAADDIATRGGHLVARGRLAQALSTQLASAQALDAPVKIGLSYRTRGDEYCRSFTLVGAGTGGLACRRDSEWQLRVVAQDRLQAGSPDKLRMAASPVSAAVLKVVDEQIQGSPLDAQGEREAMQRGWR